MKLLWIALACTLAGCMSRGPDIPLIRAARGGDIAEIRRLVESGDDPNVIGGVNGWPALMHAIHKNQLASAGALLDAGADPDARARDGQTALMMAAGYGNTAMVRLLLDRGADPRLETSRGLSALTLAVSGVADIDRFTLGKCQCETVKILLDRDPDLKLRDNIWNHLALHAAKFARAVTAHKTISTPCVQ